MALRYDFDDSMNGVLIKSPRIAWYTSRIVPTQNTLIYRIDTFHTTHLLRPFCPGLMSMNVVPYLRSTSIHFCHLTLLSLKINGRRAFVCLGR